MTLLEMLALYRDRYAQVIHGGYEELCHMIKEANDTNMYRELMIEAVKHFEAFEPTPKPDPLGIPTVGYGHVVVGGEPPYPWTENQGAEYLVDELDQRYLPTAKHAWDSKPGKQWRIEEWDLLPPWTRAGLVSAVYNAGSGIITGGSWPTKPTDSEAGNIFYKYSTGRDRATGRRIRLPGLVRRRFFEWKLMTQAEIDFYPAGWQEWYHRHKL